MNKYNELEKASMAFKLESGEVLLISNEDINEIANKVIVEMLVHHQNKVYLHKNTAKEKYDLLYTVYTEQKESMSEDMQDQYLKRILELFNENESTFITLEEDQKSKEIKP